MNEMLDKGTPQQLAQVTQAFLKMKKFDIAQLQDAFDGGLARRIGEAETDIRVFVARRSKND